MKRLLMVVVLLALVSSLFAFTVPVNDEARVRIAVKMKGLEWTLETWNTAGIWTGTGGFAGRSFYEEDVTSAQIFHFGTDTLTVIHVTPCEYVQPIFWIENTGGVSLDLAVMIDIASGDIAGTAGSHWWTVNGTFSGATDCISAYGSATSAETDNHMQVWFALSNMYVPTMYDTQLFGDQENEVKLERSAANYESDPWKEIDAQFFAEMPTNEVYRLNDNGINLVAEDPTSVGDGTPVASQDDQLVAHFFYGVPPTANEFGLHTQWLTFHYRAEIADLTDDVVD